MKEKFELYVSLREDRNGTEAFLASRRVITVPFEVIITAICLHERYKIEPANIAGYIITSSGIKLLSD